MILIVHPTQKEARQTAEVFYYMGIPASARRPKEALSALSLCFRAVLVCKPSALPCPEEYVDRLRAIGGGVPIFALNEAQEDLVLSPLFDGAFDSSLSSASILLGIRQLQRRRGLPLLGAYSLAGLVLDCELVRPCYCDRPMDLTRTEAMILRYLVRCYPEYADVHHILRFAMRPTCLSEPAGIRTHICSINRKFMQIAGRRLIASLPGEGYRILTPECEAALL
ncbi:MAG: helix-turn-helix domain-containing protein [Clostridia bacterium]|nr:helix-turn-helix domain-containing protein [Clostridia bacterium]